MRQIPAATISPTQATTARLPWIIKANSTSLTMTATTTICAIQRVFQMGHGILTLLIRLEILVEILPSLSMPLAIHTLFTGPGTVGN